MVESKEHGLECDCPICKVQRESIIENLSQAIRKLLFEPKLDRTWKCLEKKPDGAMYQSDNGIRVIISVAREYDDKIWLHVSLSRKSRMPEYKDLKRVKDLFIGKDFKAIMVLPEEKEHINFHPYCLHLFTCLEGDPLPDFTHGVGMI